MYFVLHTKYMLLHLHLKIFKTKYLIWLDADIKTYKKLPLEFLDTIINQNSYMSYLGRENISVKHLNY